VNADETHDLMATEQAPTVWESLAWQARQLAEQVERVAALAPADRRQHAPDDNVTVDELSMLDQRALDVRALAAACRRDTYQALRDEHGWTVARIAKHYNVTDKAVYKVLSGGPTHH
jgi:uncharacterized protein YerC